MIFTKSMEQGIVPSSWKQAHVNAIFKKGDRKEAKKLQTYHSLSICGKVLESIVRDKIVSHMMTNNLFCDEQHGFVPGRSCVTQLLCVMEMWTNFVFVYLKSLRSVQISILEQKNYPRSSKY